jgi:putative transposase
MSVSLDIKVNDLIVRDERLYRYALELPNDRMLFLPIEEGNGNEFTCSESRFEKLFQIRKIKPYAVVRDAEGNIVREQDLFDIAPKAEDSPKVMRARSLFYYLSAWYRQPTSLYHQALEDFVDAHAQKAKEQGHEWEPSSGTMHRAIIKYPDISQLTSRFLISRSGQVKREYWHPRVAGLLEQLIDWYWEKDTRGRNYIEAYAEFDLWFIALLEELKHDPSVADIKKPSDETLRAYINSAECFETYAKKYSVQEADAKFKGNVHPIEAKKLLDVVLIDSTVLDTWCVLDDETLLPLGRPTLTVAIDLATRMILAAVVTYEPPSLYTAMACLKRVNMPKHDINVRWPSVKRHSDGWGKPHMVVVDNELSQIGKSFQAAAEDAKIKVRWAPVKRPQYKAVVERFFLTLKLMLLDKLPGGLPYKPPIMTQLGIDPSKTATITLSKLTELINQTINDVYHYKKHSTTGMPPARAWEISKRKNKRPYISDIDFLDKAFGALGTAVLTTSGVRFDTMQFHDPTITTDLLNDLAREEPKRKRRKSRLSSAAVHVMFKYNPADISKIHVWNSKTKKYVSLPNMSGDASLGLSKWHWRILRIWAEQENIAFSTPAEQLDARRRLRENVEATIPHEAYKTIKMQRRVLHEPSEIIDGDVVLMTEAAPTVNGMSPDDIEIEVALHAPSGNRIPSKGPVRGGKRGKGGRRKRRQVEMPPAGSAPNATREALIAAFAEECRPAIPPTPKPRPSDFDASFDAIFRKHNANLAPIDD